MSLDRERQAHAILRDNLSWYLDDGRGVGVYRHVAELPSAHVLVENECAVMRPAASKADQTAEHFGNQQIYLPVAKNDENNATLALAELERSNVCMSLTAPPAGPRRFSSPALRTHRSIATTSTACSMRSRSRRSRLQWHGAVRSIAVAYSQHRATKRESDNTIQALCRWRTAASLKIYARINPRDYTARVRRMS